MKFNYTRKINPKRFFPEFQYETVDFTVLDADTPQEAMKAVEEWIEEWIKQTQEKIDSKTLKDVPEFNYNFSPSQQKLKDKIK